MLLAAGFATV